jgi:hypothetical protein
MVVATSGPAQLGPHGGLRLAPRRVRQVDLAVEDGRYGA